LIFRATGDSIGTSISRDMPVGIITVRRSGGNFDE
jgi:hypothetical protein